MKLQHYHYSPRPRGRGRVEEEEEAEEGGEGGKEARGSAKLSEDIKNKIRRRASGRIKGDDCAALRITKDRGRGRKGDSREACIMDRYCCVSMRPPTSARIKAFGGFSAPRFPPFFISRAPKRRELVRWSGGGNPLNNFESDREHPRDPGRETIEPKYPALTLALGVPLDVLIFANRLGVTSFPISFQSVFSRIIN